MSEDQVQPIIVKRVASREMEAAKGGVWKIAYADFMTAMMAFFLVMWLINATSESTKQGLANYFNPINLADAKMPTKGLDSAEKVGPSSGGTGQGTGGDLNTGGGEPTGAPEGTAPTDPSAAEIEAIFRDPYAVLAEIAQEEGINAPPERRATSDPSGIGDHERDGRNDLRDPFDPVTRDDPRDGGDIPDATLLPLDTSGRNGQTAESPDGTEGPELVGSDSAMAAPAGGDGALPHNGRSESGDRLAGYGPEGEMAAGRGEEGEAAAGHGDDGSGSGGAGETGDKGGGTGETGDKGAGLLSRGGGAGGGLGPGGLGRRDQLKLRIEASLAGQASDSGKGGLEAPSITVEEEEGDILISLTDDEDFGLFAVGSAEPRRQTVEALGVIGKILADQPGAIVVRGHTDARPYRSATYDNWRLSTARAHMAHYMLVRGGLDAARVLRIEGRADRDPAVPADPLAPGNRRIEILLRQEGI